MGKVRDARFDTLKGLLILSVVFGHFFSHEATHSAPSEAIANFIYSFHMPLFVFISGYFTNNQRVIQRGGVRILETYIVFQLIKGIWLDYSVLDLLIKPGPMLWYLFSLFFWRLIYAGMCRIGIRVSWYLIFSLILLSVLVGYIPWVGREFALSRFIFFAPYFFLGILIKKNNIIDEIKKKVSLKTAIIVMIITGILSCFIVIYPIIGRGTFAGADPYPENRQLISMVARFLSYITSTVVSIAFIRIFSFENKLLGTIGKDSLKYYMFHGLCLMGIEAIVVPWSTLLAAAYALVFSAIIFLFNKTKLSDFVINPISFIIQQTKTNNNG